MAYDMTPSLYFLTCSFSPSFLIKPSPSPAMPPAAPAPAAAVLTCSSAAVRACCARCDACWTTVVAWDHIDDQPQPPAAA